MADANIPTPDFFDISDGAQKAAAAAMSQGAPLKVPADATSSTDKKGNVRSRWTEAAVIEGTWREGTKDGLIVAVVQLKVRAGFPNEHQRLWSRHSLNPRVMAGTATEDEKKKHTFMNDNSINALSTLFSATGYASKTGGLKASVLQLMFPPKGQPGVNVPIVGKSVMVNLCDSPNAGEGAKHDRRTNVESYLPDAPTV